MIEKEKALEELKKARYEAELAKLKLESCINNKLFSEDLRTERMLRSAVFQTIDSLLVRKFETHLKPGRVDLELSFTELTLGRGIAEKKKQSLRQLKVQHFGKNWEGVQRLQWYKTLLLNGLSEGETTQQNNGDEICDYLDDE
ncbi:hypothetical protein FQA39_LY12410 [Lamprigera yunnana]|nr:hypothetical protein FQA39_LY12410 [Lamprigera yunnana]